MARRRSPPAKSTEIPADFTEHDGSGCPVDPNARPALMMRSGLRIAAGTQPAKHWMNFASGDLWAWADRRQDNWDIVAFQPEL